MSDESKYKKALERIMYELSLTELYKESIYDLFESDEILIMLDGRIGEGKGYLHPLKVRTTFGWEKLSEKNSTNLDLYDEWCEYLDGYGEGHEEQKEAASLYVDALEGAAAKLKEKYLS